MILCGKDRMALFSFIQSLNTTFGTSIFEPVAIELAKSRFSVVKNQFLLGNEIYEGYQQAIQQIINKLSTAECQPNKIEEIQRIKEARYGQKNTLKTVKVDLYLETSEGEIYLFDLKTAKPNITEFKSYKRTLLEWAAIVLTKNENAQVHSLIAIPYNPYEPKPYERWTIKGMLDDKQELLVGKEFWDFLGGKDTYEDLLDCFEKSGIEIRNDIDEYFSKFKDNF
ncbi:MAG TPA: TdeIII family type II restriction endonuclease [Spirochaetota bacterium]|nr:TdeIII family type II restriction endonuclease [Spirochaetota bacterium]